MAKLLMVDDDEDLCLTVAEWLTVNEHHVVEIVHSGEEALYRMKHVGYDVVILDVNLGTDVGGLDVCHQFRSGGGITPIIMLTGRDQIRDKEAGFESGSDDYLTKPFEIRELATRVRALLRRPRQWQASLLSAGTLTLDPARFEVRKNGELLQLSPVDFALLEFFMRNPNEVFSQNVLLDRVWHSDKDATSDALRTAVKRLRKKIDDSDDVNKSMIETVRRVGYRFRPTS